MSRYLTCEETAEGGGDAIQAAVDALAHQGFRIEQDKGKSATLVGPGMHSTRQNPLVGASEITLRVEGGMLHAEAELGGVDTMRRFLFRFPLLLGLGLGLTFAVAGGLAGGRAFGGGFGVPWAPGWRWLLLGLAAGLLPVAPWLVLSPLMARRIRRRTESAIDALIHNATFAARGHDK